MKITKIVKQERRDRYNIFADDQFVTALSAELLLESGISEGTDLVPGQLEPFIERDEAGKVFNQALRYLSRRPHSEYELRVKMKQKKLNEGLIEEAFTRLRKLEYLDDLDFSRQWIEERGRQRGARMLHAELKRKGVAEEVIRQALTETEQDEFADAKALAVKRLSRLSGDTPLQVRQKLTRYLAGRGYSFETAREVIDSLEASTAN